MVLNVLVVLCQVDDTINKPFMTYIHHLKLTQVEVVVNGVASSEDTENEVEQGSDGGIVAINVASLVTTPESRRLGRFNGTLGQVLQSTVKSMCLLVRVYMCKVVIAYLVEGNKLSKLGVLGTRARDLGGSSNVRRNESLGGVGTTNNGVEHVVYWRRGKSLLFCWPLR